MKVLRRLAPMILSCAACSTNDGTAPVGAEGVVFACDGRAAAPAVCQEYLELLASRLESYLAGCGNQRATCPGGAVGACTLTEIDCDSIRVVSKVYYYDTPPPDTAELCEADLDSAALGLSPDDPRYCAAYHRSGVWEEP